MENLYRVTLTGLKYKEPKKMNFNLPASTGGQNSWMGVQMPEHSKEHQDILMTARDRYGTVHTATEHIVAAALENIKFAYNVESGQWPENSSILGEIPKIHPGSGNVTTNACNKST